MSSGITNAMRYIKGPRIEWVRHDDGAPVAGKRTYVNLDRDAKMMRRSPKDGRRSKRRGRRRLRRDPNGWQQIGYTTDGGVFLVAPVGTEPPR